MPAWAIARRCSVAKVITETDVDLVVTEGAHTRLNKPEVMALLRSSRTKKLIVSHRYDQANTDGMVAELVAYTKDKFETVLAFDGMVCEL